MFYTTQALIASLIIMAIVLAMFGYYMTYMQTPSVPVEGPTEVTGYLNLTCTKTTLSDGSVSYEIVSAMDTLLTIGIKNHLGTSVTIDKITPISGNVSYMTTEINPPVTIPPYGYMHFPLKVNWANISGLVMRVYPGDVLSLQRGVLERESSGLVKIYQGNLPSTTPSNYACPFTGTQIYKNHVSGDTMSTVVENPGCAPLLAVSNYINPKMLVIGSFSVLEYYYDDWDIPFYIHVYGDPKTDTFGVYFRGGPDSGHGFGLINEYYRNPNNPFANEYDPELKNPMYFAYWIDSTTGTIAVYADDKTTPVLTDTATISATDMTHVVVGIAREKPAKSSLYLALVIDNSLSMSDDWQSLYNAISSAVDVLKEKNTHLALMDFTGPNCNCHGAPYCDPYVRIQSYFTQDYDKILQLIQNTPTSCWAIEPDADAIYKAAALLDWSNKPSDARVILLATDECDQAVYYTHEEAIKEAKKNDIIIFVVRSKNANNACWPSTYATGKTLDDYAAQTGGQVLVLGRDANNLGQALINLLENINLQPAEIKTQVPILGIFKDRTITIKGLYPGDRVVIATPNKVISIEAQTDVLTVDLLQYFGPEDLIEAIEQGGIILAVQPTVQHLLVLIPSSMMVHVKGKNLDTWIEVPVLLVPKCTLKAELSNAPNGVVKIERTGELYKVYLSVDGGRNWFPFGVYPKVYITDINGYEISIEYSDGTKMTFSEYDHVDIDGRYVMMPPGLGMFLISNKIVYMLGGGVFIEDDKDFDTIYIRAPVVRVEGYFGK